MIQLQPLRNQMRDDGIAFCFTGFMTEDVLLGIGRALRQKMEIDSVDRNTAKGLYSIFVELVQNVIRYSAEAHPEEGDPDLFDLRYGVLAVGTKEDRHFIACGNMVENIHVERLTEGLEHIQSLDRDGVKKLYKKTLKGDVPEGSKGAGVGFIEIARRAGNGFEFNFERADDRRSFFTVTAYL